jgi:hypothetical protein
MSQVIYKFTLRYTFFCKFTGMSMLWANMTDMAVHERAVVIKERTNSRSRHCTAAPRVAPSVVQETSAHSRSLRCRIQWRQQGLIAHRGPDLLAWFLLGLSYFLLYWRHGKQHHWCVGWRESRIHAIPGALQSEGLVRHRQNAAIK